MLARSDIGIDLGTSKFSLCARGEGLVLSEAATIAFRGDSISPKNIVAIGSEAESMRGRTSKGVQVVCPMNQGIIESPYTASLLLKGLSRKAGLLGFFSRKPRIVVGTLFGASPIETKAFVDVAAALGSSNIIPIKEPLAAAIGSAIPIDEAHGHMLIDIGSGSTEAIILSSKKIVRGQSIRVGGQSMDEALIQMVNKRYGLLLAPEIARSAKERLSSRLPDEEGIRLLGMDQRSFLPKALYLSKTEILDAIQQPLQRILETVECLLAETEPDLMADLIESGISLCGGGSLTLSLKEQLEARTHLEVKIGQEPSQAVARGCYAMLDYAKYLA